MPPSEKTVLIRRPSCIVKDTVDTATEWIQRSDLKFCEGHFHGHSASRRFLISPLVRRQTVPAAGCRGFR
mgnify:CR=1 FL=1